MLRYAFNVDLSIRLIFMRKTIKIIIALVALTLTVGVITSCGEVVDRDPDGESIVDGHSEVYSEVGSDSGSGGDVESSVEGSDESVTVNAMTYEQYNALSATEQEAFFNSFDTVEDFFAWYNQAKQEYENNQNYIDAGGKPEINFGDGGKN